MRRHSTLSYDINPTQDKGRTNNNYRKTMGNGRKSSTNSSRRRVSNNYHSMEVLVGGKDKQGGGKLGINSRLKVQWNIISLVNNQAYMQFKDYLTVKQYYLNNAGIFLQIKQHQKVNSENIIDNNKKQHSFLENEVINLYKIVLIAAKCYYLQNQYESVISTLTKDLPLESNSSIFPFKIIYQRQLLLLKSVYLLTPTDASALKRVREDYRKNKESAKDWEYFADEDGKEFYDGNMEELCNQTINGSNSINNNDKIDLTNSINNINSLKTELNKNFTIFQGIPIYLLSKRWLQKCITFITSVGNNHEKSSVLYPGPALNLELLNHIFQFQIHPHMSKSYMDTLLFPGIQDIDYVVISKKMWQGIVNQFGGIPIKRYPIINGSFTDRKMCDTLSKMILQCNDKQYLLQWQIGTYWQKSVVPGLNDQFKKFLGLGQLKQIIYVNETSTRGSYNKYKIVEAGVVTGQGTNRYKYIQFTNDIVNKIPINILKKIRMKYDLESYEVDSGERNGYTRGIIGMDKEQDMERLYRSVSRKNCISGHTHMWENDSLVNAAIKQFISGIVYTINAIIQSLSNIYQLTRFYLTNTFISNLNDYYKKKYTNKLANNDTFNQRDLTMTYAHIIKNLWCSEENMESINSSLIVREYLLEKLSGLSIMKCKDKIDKWLNAAPDVVLSEILSYLHEDIAVIQAPQPSQQSGNSPPYFYSSFDGLQNACIKNVPRMSRSFIQNLCSFLSYNVEVCCNCKIVLGYRFVSEFVVGIKLPQLDVEVVRLFFVYGSEEVKRSNNENNVPLPKTQTSQHNPPEQKPSTKSPKTRGKKIVQELSIKMKSSSTVKQLYKLIAKHYRLFYKQNRESGQEEPTSNFVMVITDQNMEGYQQIPQNKTIKQINKLRKIRSPTKTSPQIQKQQKQIKKLIFIFLLNQTANNEQLMLISYRNRSTKKNKGFPQLVIRNKLEKMINKNQWDVEIVKSMLYDHLVEISEVEVIHNKQLSNTNTFSNKSNIISLLYLTTPTEIGNKQRSSSIINLSCDYTDSLTHIQNHQYSLQELMYAQFCKNGEEQQSRLSYQKGDKNREQYRIVQEGKIMCKKCDNIGTEVLRKRLLEVRKIFAISINQQKMKEDYGMQSVQYPITNLSIKPFIKNYESQTKKKSVTSLYNLKAVIFSNSCLKSHSNQNQLSEFNNINNFNNKAATSTKQPQYSCVAKNSISGLWYLYTDERVREISIQQFSKYFPKLLIYERQQQLPKERCIKNGEISERQKK